MQSSLKKKKKRDLNFCRKDPGKALNPCNWVLGRGQRGRGGLTTDFGEGGHWWRGPKGQGARGGLGAPVGGFDWGSGWPEKLVGDGQGAAARVDGGEVVLVREKAD